MFPLRPGNDGSEFDDDVQPDLDPGVLDRLSAYTSEESDAPVDPHEAYPGLTDELFESREQAVDDGPPAELPPANETEPVEPGTDTSYWDSEAAEPEAFSATEWTSAPESPSVEHAEFELDEPPPYPPQQEAADAEPPESGLPVAEAIHPELPALEPSGAVVAATDVIDVELDALEAAEPASELPLSEAPPADLEKAFAPAVAEESEAPARRSFRRRRDTRSEAGDEPDAGKRRSPKEKRGSRDRKARKLVGLKIGSSQIAAAEVVNNGAPELVEVFREPLEPGLVVSGEIRDPEALGASLKRLFELHKLPKRGVRLGIANNRIGVRIFEIEGVGDAQQLDNAIRFRAEEVLPIPLDQAVLDYVVLEDAVREDGTPWKRILLVVAYREVVDRYLQACRSAGLEVVGIDLEAFALLRAVEAPTDRGADAGALVAVAIGHDRTTIAVSTGRYCEFTRVLDWGGWSLNVAIARELDKAPSEVEGLKRRLSFAGPTEVEGFTPEQTAKAREAIQRSLSAFVRELVASLQFYQAQPGALGIGEVVLTGGTAHMDGLPDALGEQIGVPIRVGDPFKRVKVGPKVAHEGPRGSLSVAIGLGIED